MKAAEQMGYYVSDNDFGFLSNVKTQLDWGTQATHCWKKNAWILNTFDSPVCGGETVALTACIGEVKFHLFNSFHPSPTEYF